MPRFSLPRSAYNLTSLSGAIVAGITAMVLGIALVAQMFFVHETNPYVGILLYMVLPPILIAGLVLIPVGMVHKRRMFRKRGEEMPTRWPHLDLNNSRHRNGTFIFIGGTVLFAIISIVGGYQTFHFTESVEFCGTTCHEVMKPEHVAYQSSPHARVLCVSCHVGEGASWYARSKLSGLYQVYATVRNIYPRPIETPVHSLRPAQETCERCHWPEKFFGAQQRQYNHYMYDEGNTYWPINLLIRTGGGDPATGQNTGIHWHMNIGNTVEYIARDYKRQDIPWIRVTNAQTGRVTVFHDEGDPLTQAQIDSLEVRKMDCMDCHNRPSHKYRAPDYLVDEAMLTDRIDATLPSIKLVAVEAMAVEYETEDEAMLGIRRDVTEFYEGEHGDIFEARRHDIERSIVAIQEQFNTSIFPEMKVRWEHYPDNAGHMIFPGCMRCHDGNHKNDEGISISRECVTCHVILRQGYGDEMEVAFTEEGLEFKHPDGDDDWRDTGCYECHEGVEP